MKSKPYKIGHRVTTKRWVKPLVISSLALIVLVVTGLAGAYSWYKIELRPRESFSTEEKLITIKKGLSSNAIASLLEEQSIIKSSTAFSWYVSREGVKNKLQAGTYQLGPNLSVQDVVERLVSGDVARRTVTLVPGRRLDQLRSAMVEAGYDATTVKQAVESSGRQKLAGILPDDADLEGYLMAETYVLNLDDQPAVLVDQAISQLLLTLTPDIRSGIERQDLSIHEAVILASIIQQESSQPDVQRQIAQVFLLRLDRGISLGADPTFRYAAAISGEPASPGLDHPYNTRIYKGLPPGPIGNFNPSPILAVADPAEGDYLFFVAGDDGVTRFSRTLAEHEALKARYCIELCKL